jgi:hypothetical protein
MSHAFLGPQFESMRALRVMESTDYPDTLMRDVEGAMQARWDADPNDTHPQEIKHGGPSAYIDALAEDIKENGFKKPIMVMGGTVKVVVDGHHRALAAMRLGLTHVPVERGGLDWVE